MLHRSFALIFLLLASCTGLRMGVDDRDVDALLAARDYFELRDRLEGMPHSAERLVIEATVLNAFNEPGASNAAIEELLEEADLSEEHRLHLLRLRRDNYLRMHRYDEAYDAARAVLEFPAFSIERRRDDENVTLFMRALRRVGPQTAEIRGDSHVRPDTAGHVPITINGHDRAYAIDTGANFSVLMRSEAEAMGLDILPTAVEVGTSTDVNMLADVAVADSVRIANVHYENVVFLIFADAALTLSNEFRIRGLIGFPLMEAMREVHFMTDGSLRIPRQPTAPAVANLALDGLDPLIEARWRRSELLCRLDSGAGTTDFYEPFYRRHQILVERLGTLHRSQTGGVGGVREFEVYLIPDLQLGVGGRSVRIPEADVYTRPLAAEESNYLDCNIGRDVLRQFGEYILNFETMSMVLR